MKMTLVLCACCSAALAIGLAGCRQKAPEPAPAESNVPALVEEGVETPASAHPMAAPAEPAAEALPADEAPEVGPDPAKGTTLGAKLAQGAEAPLEENMPDAPPPLPQQEELGQMPPPLPAESAGTAPEAPVINENPSAEEIIQPEVEPLPPGENLPEIPPAEGGEPAPEMLPTAEIQ